jgi:hypothetical protein
MLVSIECKVKPLQGIEKSCQMFGSTILFQAKYLLQLLPPSGLSIVENDRPTTFYRVAVTPKSLNVSK